MSVVIDFVALLLINFYFITYYTTYELVSNMRDDTEKKLQHLNNKYIPKSKGIIDFILVFFDLCFQPMLIVSSILSILKTLIKLSLLSFIIVFILLSISAYFPFLLWFIRWFCELPLTFFILSKLIKL